MKTSVNWCGAFRRFNKPDNHDDMLPCHREPSCRCLPSRVFTYLRYDAHGLRQASSVSTPSRPSPQIPDDGVSIIDIFSSRLQPTSRYVHPDVSGRKPETSLAFLPFQRHPLLTRQTGFRTRRSPSTGFRNLPTGSFVHTTARVYSTPLALVGSGPPESDPGHGRWLFSSPMLLRRWRPFTVSFLEATGSSYALPPRFEPVATSSLPGAWQTLRPTRSRRRVSPTLKLCSHAGAPRSCIGFTRRMRRQLSWPSVPSGYCSVCALGCPSPSWGFDPCKVLLHSRMTGPLARSGLPSWIFCLLMRTPTLKTLTTRGYRFPSGCAEPSPVPARPPWGSSTSPAGA